ncbi:MAG: mandelate racemase/muconate lactonizing enzyme family protein, partial [Alphaproteobacteria bacterium]|nr:mandelate racemase/muconate lactonizing enzyme family protein [Alphaproteobacteria bacterium]
MHIKSVDVIPLRIPFEDGSDKRPGLMPTKWTELDIALVRVETDDGIVGWGDGFAYACRRATVAAIEDLVAPQVIGKEITDIAAFNRELQLRLHLHGRYGITMFAISAIDIALWDIAAKEQGVPLANLLGGRQRETLPAYASLMRYTDPGTVHKYAAKAASEGYGLVKLHEIALDSIEAGRDAVGDDLKLTTDVNCNWKIDQALELMPHMKRLGLYWVEEPVFPPDDEKILSALQEKFGVSIASGENACTHVEFARIIPKIDFCQPSVIKVGGISEFMAICYLANTAGKTLMPHAPYFGPGYWATAQLMAAQPVCGLFEHLYIEPEAYLDPSIPLPRNGEITVPEKPGLGFEP